MRLYFYGFCMLIKKFILGKNTGDVVLWFSKKMGVVYIKLAQILAMQNIGNLFTEEDRQKLTSICDHCNPIAFQKIKKIMEKEYGCDLSKKFKKIYEEPLGSASISQVHKAVLKNGTVVAIKVKRQDVLKKVKMDIKQIRKLIHRFGKFFKFQNIIGSDVALNMYLDWILEETDFEHEIQNIIDFSRFAKSVNKTILNTKKIVVPFVYKKMCTKNIIVMEFIPFKTINQISFHEKNKAEITKCFNDYIRLTFYAMFHEMPVIFHGDPHGGNIYLDKNGNIGFLDMGLMFSFSKEEIELVRKLFFLAYSCKVSQLFQLLTTSTTLKKDDLDNLKSGIEECCKNLRKIPVTQFFIDMINLYTGFNIDAPSILYKMAKAFVALYGLNMLLENDTSTEDLLKEQIIEFYMSQITEDMKNLTKEGMAFIPNFIHDACHNGLVKTISSQIIQFEQFHKKISSSLNKWQELLSFFQE